MKVKYVIYILYIVKTKNIYECNYFKIVDGISVGEKSNEIDFSSFTVYIYIYKIILINYSYLILIQLKLLVLEDQYLLLL